MDFFRLILDRLHEELKYAVPASAMAEDSGNRKMRRKSGRLAAMKNGSEEEAGEKVVWKSVVSDTFGGVLRSEVKCHKCHKVKGSMIVSVILSVFIISYNSNTYLGVSKG